MDTTTFEYPSLWRRFMAIIYECILLGGPAFLMAFFFLFFFTESDQKLSYSSQNTFALRLLLFIMFSIYFTWSWSYHRCTLPMKTLNLKIVDLQGNDISLSKAFIRFLVAIPSILSGLWIIVALIRKDNQCLHDVVSNTQLVLKT